MNKLIPILFILLLGTPITQAQNKQTTNTQDHTTSSEEVTESDVDTALKETLKQSAQTSVEELNKKNSFSPTEILGTKKPRKVQKLTKTLEDAGQEELLTEFGSALSDALQSILSGAMSVIDKEIDDLTFQDAYKVLKAGNSAATDYLEKQAGEDIENQLSPIVEKALTASGALDKWSALASEYSKLTGKSLNMDLPKYLTDKAIDDIFENMRKEEAKIRVNAYLWKSLIMKHVFKRQTR